METNNPSQTPKKPLTDNWITLFGFVLALVFLVGESIIIAADILMGHKNPYVGILIYLVGPSILIVGLILVPLGMWREHRKRVLHIESKILPVFDLNNTRHRTYLFTFTIVTTFFLTLSMIGTYQAYHITESVEFCGLVCHQVMKPEYTAFQQSSHARVACVSCHIGPGAGWFVKSKLSGAHQVYAVLTNSYHLPIKTPIENLRPARDTCEQCHWPEKFYESVEKSWTFYGSDDTNDPYRVDLLLHVGKKTTSQQNLVKQNIEGIHWHIGLDHKLEYYATDEKRQDIPWVRVTYNNGTIKEYIDSSATDFDQTKMDPEKIRVMDCIDCHNRPSHHFNSPQFAVNNALAFGLIDPKLPGIKSQIVELLEKPYKSTEEALSNIETELQKSYEESLNNDASLKPSIDQAVQQAKRIYSTNIFPEQNVDWSHYPVNIGHFEFPGCYRCHDDQHKLTGSEEVISNDCALCHSIIRQEEGWDRLSRIEYKEQSFSHPRGIGDDWQGQNCHECHGPASL